MFIEESRGVSKKRGAALKSAYPSSMSLSEEGSSVCCISGGRTLRSKFFSDANRRRKGVMAYVAWRKLV